MLTRIILFCLIFVCATQPNPNNGLGINVKESPEEKPPKRKRRKLFLDFIGNAISGVFGAAGSVFSGITGAFGGIIKAVSAPFIAIKDAIFKPILKPFVDVADAVTGGMVGNVLHGIDQGVTGILQGQPPGSKCTEEVINKCVVLLQDCVKWAFEQRPFGDPYCGFASAECDACKDAGCPMDQLKAELEKALKKEGLLKPDGSVIDVPEEQPPAPLVRERPGRPGGSSTQTYTKASAKDKDKDKDDKAAKEAKEDEDDEDDSNMMMYVIIGVLALVVILAVVFLLTRNRQQLGPLPMHEEAHHQRLSRSRHSRRSRR